MLWQIKLILEVLYNSDEQVREYFVYSLYIMAKSNKKVCFIYVKLQFEIKNYVKIIKCNSVYCQICWNEFNLYLKP